jgi:hypothetical protein
LFGISGLFLIYISAGVIAQNFIGNYSEYLKVISFAYLLGHIPFLLFSTLASEIRFISYSGIFSNPNSLGTVAATTFIVYLPFIYRNLEKIISTPKFKYIIILFGNSSILLFLFFLTIISSSRTNFIAAVTVFVVTFLLFMYKNLKKNKLSSGLTYRIFIILFVYIFSIMVILQFTYFGELVNNSIVSKFEKKSEDILASRGVLWSTTINDASLFGHGREYFPGSIRGSHNSFISILGQYGVISAIVFVLLCLNLLFYGYKYAIKTNDNINFLLPISITLLFILQSMGEGMFLKSTMLLMFSISNITLIKN